MLRKTLLVCGILSSLLYAVMIVFIGCRGKATAPVANSQRAVRDRRSDAIAVGAARRRLHRARDRLRMGRLEVGRSKSSPAHRRAACWSPTVLGLLWPFAPMHPARCWPQAVAR